MACTSALEKVTPTGLSDPVCDRRHYRTMAEAFLREHPNALFVQVRHVCSTQHGHKTHWQEGCLVQQLTHSEHVPILRVWVHAAQAPWAVSRQAQETACRSAQGSEQVSGVC